MGTPLPITRASAASRSVAARAASHAPARGSARLAPARRAWGTRARVAQGFPGLLVVLLLGAPVLGNAQILPPPVYGQPQLLPNPYQRSGEEAESDRTGQRRERPWTFTPSLGLLETFTNNVDLVSRDDRRSDAVTQITPSLFIDGVGPYASLRGTIAAPILIYARTGDENNKVWPQVDLVGDVALFDRVLHVEGAVSVVQQFFTPFGAQPADLASATDNRYRTETYRISPYVKGVTVSGTEYELRNNNVWTNLNGAPISTSNQKFYQVYGTASNTRRQLGWRANFDYSNTVFNEQDKVYFRLARAEPVYAVTPQFRLTASVGYEDNKFPFTKERGAIYGAGFEWQPSPRAKAIGSWEHRFFGDSYLFELDHRSPLSAFHVNVSRNITTYQQQLATFTRGTSVAAMLNQLFASQLPDPVARQQFVDQFIRDRGLPEVLGGPVVLYGERILLQESQTASAAFIGARNTIVFTVYNVKSEAIAGTGNALPPVLSGGDDNTQTGGNITWTHNLTPRLLLVTSVQGSRTKATPPAVGTTDQGGASVLVSSPLSPRLSVFGGARYQTLSSDVSTDYTEVAAFVGLNYAFR